MPSHKIDANLQKSLKELKSNILKILKENVLAVPAKALALREEPTLQGPRDNKKDKAKKSSPTKPKSTGQ